ncbi:MAG: hypothetical protein COV69_02090 [Parcubacteria group bacterium CG11_big_fil_rev_8_21_14_0_20_39_14]|nr:MAG: hypothetical protein COV69_02090 [Parcubacteria group bacterium CG11_big_fil_rev_8_21_14_0_20_39_14]
MVILRYFLLFFQCLIKASRSACPADLSAEARRAKVEALCKGGGFYSGNLSHSDQSDWGSQASPVYYWGFYLLSQQFPFQFQFLQNFGIHPVRYL